MRVLQRPYQLLFLIAVILILLSLFVGNGTLDVHLSDSYLVIDGILVLRTTALFLLLNWLLYWVTRKILFSKILIWLHVVCTLIVAVVLAVILFKNGVGHYVDFSDPDRQNRIRFLVPLCIVSMIASQFFFIINLLLGILRRVNQP